MGAGPSDDPRCRRAEILARASELFAAKGVANTTVREIGEAVGILSGSLYHHFESKDAMVEEILTAYVDDLLERQREVRTRFPHDPEKCLAGLIRACFESLTAHRYACAIYQNDFNYLKTLPRYAEADEKVRAVGRIWHQVLTEGVEEGIFRADVDPRLFHYFARDAIANSVHWSDSPRRYPSDVVADACVAVFLGGLLAQRPA